MRLKRSSILVICQNKEDTYRIMVSTTADMRAWVDGKYVLGQESGPFLPAFHRAPLNQRETMVLTKGKHTLTFGVSPLTEDMDFAPLFFAEHCI